MTEPALHRSIEGLLGVEAGAHARRHSTLDWVEAVRRGIPAAAIDSLRKAAGMSQAELAQALGIPARTLARRKRDGVLSAEESAKMLRIARVLGRANEVFENASAALDWLKTPNAALAAKTPLSLLDTEFGAESVLETLGRIEHGVFP